MEEIKQTLRNILEYVGADCEYANHARLQTWLEQLIKKNNFGEEGVITHPITGGQYTVTDQVSAKPMPELVLCDRCGTALGI